MYYQQGESLTVMYHEREAYFEVVALVLVDHQVRLG